MKDEFRITTFLKMHCNKKTTLEYFNSKIYIMQLKGKK